MGKYSPRPKQATVEEKGVKEKVRYFLEDAAFKAFNPQILGLGDITKASTRTEALAASFDLAGFTKFCGQVDPHLSVPEYLSSFLEWLFREIRQESVSRAFPTGKGLWSGLPFLAKFTGDGVLFIWDTEIMGPDGIGNVILLLDNICGSYRENFHPKVRRRVSDAPPLLRCGAARGAVYSVGDGEDYVGPCINIACRLQKMSSLTFCFSRRGLDIDRCMTDKTAATYTLKKTSIRGIGDDELIYADKAEFEALSVEDKKAFKEP